VNIVTAVGNAPTPRAASIPAFGLPCSHARARSAISANPPQAHNWLSAMISQRTGACAAIEPDRTGHHRARLFKGFRAGRRAAAYRR
jgi:hypothetical protein